METLEKKFRDFLITPSMSVAPIIRTDLVKGDILRSESSWTSNLDHINDVISEMKSKKRYKTDDLSNDLEIISLSNKNKVSVFSEQV